MFVQALCEHATVLLISVGKISGACGLPKIRCGVARGQLVVPLPFSAGGGFYDHFCFWVSKFDVRAKLLPELG